MDYKKHAKDIIAAVGGQDNISSVQHCVTRLRFVLKDRSIVDEETLRNNELVKGINDANGQCQIILGPGLANKVYKEAAALVNVGNETPNLEGGTTLQKVSRFFADIFLPIIPVLVASGILMGLRSYATGSGMLATDSNWYKFFIIIVDTGFAFLVPLVSYSTAKRLGGNPVYGFVLGLMLVHSVLPGSGAVGKGNAEPLYLELLGMRFGLISYGSSVLSGIVGGWLVTKLEKLFQKVIPNVLDIILTPILVLSVSVFVIFFGIGPVLQFIEGLFVSLFQFLITLPLGIGSCIISGLQQFLVITGLHQALWVIDINLIAETGVNAYMPLRSAAVVGQAGVVLAFFLFARENKVKQLSAGATVSCMFGITEPAIFGVSLVYGVPFVLGCIGAAAGGLFAGLVGLTGAGMGVTAIPGYLIMMDQALLYTIEMLITLGVSCGLTAMYIKKKGI